MPFNDNEFDRNFRRHRRLAFSTLVAALIIKLLIGAALIWGGFALYQHFSGAAAQVPA